MVSPAPATYGGGVARRGSAPAPVHDITSARTPQSVDASSRTYRYLLSMAIRTGCFILAVVVPGPLRWFFVAGAVVLPYVAVIVANVGGQARSPGPAVVTGKPLEVTGSEPPTAPGARTILMDDDPSAGGDATVAP